MKKAKKILKWLGVLVATPIVLFLILAVLLYIPPVQNFVVHRVSERLSSDTGLRFRVGEVRLAFPLDLALHDVLATERGDTLIDARSMRLEIALRPLLDGRADIEGFSLYGLKLDTKSYIADTHIRGTAAELTAAAHGVAWADELVHVDRARLRGADFCITLSDTAAKDTTESSSAWRIDVERADIERSKIRLTMPGDSMRIAADIGTLALRGGAFDTGRGDYSVRQLTLRSCALAYDIPYEAPTEGIDPNHIAVSGLSLRLDTLTYTGAGVLRAGLQRLTLREKCGLAVNNLSGSVYMDSVTLRLPALHLATPASRIDADVAFDFRSFSEGQGGRCRLILDAALGAEDLRTLGAAYVDRQYLALLPSRPITLRATVGGNIDRLTLTDTRLDIPGMATLTAEATVRDALKDRRSGTAAFSLQTKSLAAVRRLLPASVTQTVNVPDGIAAKGRVKFNGDNYDLNVTTTLGRGSLTAKARTNLRRETYQAALGARAFPVGSFVKGMNISPFTGTLRASGSGFDPTARGASLTADARIDALSYDTYNLGGTALNAHLSGGQAKADFSINNALAKAGGTINANLDGGYDIALQTAVDQLDLRALGVTTDTLLFASNINIEAKADKAFTSYSARGSIADNRFTTPRMGAMAKDILFDFATTPDTTTALVSAGDLRLDLGARGDVPALATKCAAFAEELMAQAQNYNIDQERLKTLLPTMQFCLKAGRDNPLYNLARMKGYAFSSADIDLATSPDAGLSGAANIGALSVGALLLDTIDTRIVQDSTGVQLYGLVKNNRKNPNPLEVRLKSYLLRTGAGLELSYLDTDGDVGVDLGMQADVRDDGINVHFYPQHPVLAYRNFTVNQDNYVFVAKDGGITADVDLLADDGTGLKIYGAPQDSLNDLTVSVNRLNLGELSTVMPYLPQLSGMLSGDFHVTAAKSFDNLSAMASLEAQSFKYEGTDLGNVGIEAIYLPKTGGEHHASAFISSNGTEVLACNGTYYDRDGGTFEGDAQLHDFPLQMLNGFMAGTDVALSGIAGGDLRVEGTLDRPVVNGSLDLDSAHIYSDVYGFDFRTDERAVEIHNSVLAFDDYNLYSTGTEPLVLNGTFDMSNLDRMKMDFTMKARAFELINTKKKAQSMVYGKVYADYDGTLRGTTDNLSIKGKLAILDRTDVTYILKDSPLTVDDELSDLVTFTSFKDTTTVEEEKVVEGGLNLTLGISISDAAQFHCSLSEDGQSYVNLEGGGDLTMRMNQQGDMTMTGRFTVNSGKMKYQLPVIPLKTFELVEGSYVEFTGDMMNPTLSVQAKERTKAVVTEDDKQRSVTFDVGVAISQTLEDMGLAFTIEAPEDLSVQNEIAAMSDAQRSKAAVALLATGMYMTDENTTSGSGFKASNALNAFLQSEIQNIAGAALQTVDINLGVESGTSEVGTSTTDYSFQFSKRFCGNRISVNIGGKVSTGADATNSASSFINNVSVEYRLDNSATRYVKVFYDRDTQDPLEGQLTKGGAGLVLKKKTDRLGELFLFRKKKK